MEAIDQSKDNTAYYNTLQISQTANREEIANAYRQLALKYHPMRNSKDVQSQCYTKFVQICEAYQVLSDPLMKRIYDKYGDYSLKNGVMKGTDKFPGYVNTGEHFKVFQKFFGSSNPYIENLKKSASDEPTELERIEKSCRADDIVVVLECELFEFFNGAIKEVEYARKKLLSTTEQSVTEPHKFEIEILPGFGEQTTLVYKNLGNESFGSQPSDLVIKFAQKPKQGYMRRGDDLVVSCDITLAEAIQMKPQAISTLDNRQVFVSPENVITPQTEIRVAGEGMPCSQTGDIVIDTTNGLQIQSAQSRGDLVVKFNIMFPKRILAEHRAAMIDALRENEVSC